MDKIEDYLNNPDHWAQEDDFIACALNILKNLHRHSNSKDEYKTYLPSILDLIKAHQNTGGTELEEAFE